MIDNYNFDLDDDDFLIDTFRSISENDLLTCSASSNLPKNVVNSSLPKDLSGCLTHSNHKPIGNHASISRKELDLIEVDNSSNLLKDKGDVTVLDSRKDTENSDVCSPNYNLNRDKISLIDQRFVPGYTPKAKKRKFPGPAGVLLDDEEHIPSCDSNTEIDNITNSDFSADDLLLPSWRNLQTDISSCQTLLEVAKYYSIHRVLHETSKIKLPKRLVVPVLCVLIKKFDYEESTLIFLDDTGEISGKIYKEVFELYEENIRNGTALILKQVAFLCNMLLLKKHSIVAIYLEDGSKKIIQDFNSILDKEEQLKPLSFQCLVTPNKKQCALKTVPVPSDSQKNGPSNTNLVLKMAQGNSSPLDQRNLSKTSAVEFSSGTFSKNQVASRTVDSSVSKKNVNPIHVYSALSRTISEKQMASTLKELFVKQTIHNPSEEEGGCSNNVASTSFEVDVFCGDSSMDDFDELLGSLDEKSFLKET